MSHWTANANPFGSVLLSAGAAAIPIAFLFWALAVRRMKGHHTALYAAAAGVGVAVAGFRMPVGLALGATGLGMLYGLWPVAWIVLTAVFLYNLSVRTGQFEVIKNSLASITEDRRLQALLIAFSFGAFLEGAAGFGTPVAISAAMLVGLGFDPLYAAGLCLIANTAPVAFGAIGIPVIVAGQVSGIDAFSISQMVGRTLPVVSLLIPFYLVILMAGRRRGLEVWPAALVSGGSFAVAQFLCANLLGPMLPDIIASITSIVCLTLFLRAWRPARVWRFRGEAESEGKERLRFTGGQVLRAWTPFIVLSLFVGAWGVKPVQQALDHLLLARWSLPGLDGVVIRDGAALPAVFKLNVLGAAGTSILFTALVSLPVLGATPALAARTFLQTIRTLRFPVLTISLVLGFAYIMNYSGMANALANAFSETGRAFPLLAPFLGWLGVLMTGSDTSANALFGKLQQVTASKLGIDPVIAVAANTSGGVCGKMISPQSLAVATASVGLVGKESEIFRFTLKHSIVLTAAIALLVFLQSTALHFLVPTAGSTVTPASRAPDLIAQGERWLGVVLVSAAVLVALATWAGRPRREAVGARPAG
ncbi:MAG TPA: lactate permease LctP family transporter [Anaeromyxobacter sp.]|nr:lactate permease LctP family transporter [Anaeromyxobacter sp.]